MQAVKSNFAFVDQVECCARQAYPLRKFVGKSFVSEQTICVQKRWDVQSSVRKCESHVYAAELIIAICWCMSTHL